MDSSSFTITRENLSAARVGPRKALEAEVQRQRDRAARHADRAGRRPAMLLTIALITLGTLGLALTPSYERIGLAALLGLMTFALFNDIQRLVTG